jgi:hypothetical protein
VIIRPFLTALRDSIVWDSTLPTRFWFALADLFFAMYMMTPVAIDDFAVMDTAIPMMSHSMWATLFAIHGLALLRGITGRYGFVALLFEGVLGVGIWGITAITHAMVQGMPGVTSVMLLMQIWLLWRYPRRWTSE